MGTTASTTAHPIEQLNYTLEDLKSNRLFNEKHKRIYDEFFKEGWYNQDEIKLKAVLFLLQEYCCNHNFNKIKFEKNGVRFSFYGSEKEGDGIFDIQSLAPDFNRRFLILKYIENNEIENLDQIKNITIEELFNGVLKTYLKDTDKTKILELLKIYYVFSVFENHSLFSVDEYNSLKLPEENKIIFFDYIANIDINLYLSIKFYIKIFLRNFNKEDILK